MTYVAILVVSLYLIILNSLSDRSNILVASESNSIDHFIFLIECYILFSLASLLATSHYLKAGHLGWDSKE